MFHGFYYTCVRTIFVGTIVEIEKLSIADALFEINSRPTNKIPDLDNHIKKFSDSHDVTYNDDQKRAIAAALEENVTIITGGPGTGKTTIVRAIAGLFIDMHPYSEKQALEEIAFPYIRRTLHSTTRCRKTRFFRVFHLCMNKYHRHRKTIVSCEKQALEEIALLAPTGRAAKRLSDLTGLPAMTIHR